MSERTARPPTVEVGDEKPTRELRHRVRACLAQGDVVALPTETVYGLAVRADDAEAVARLRALKGRDSVAGLTWVVARRDAVEPFEALRPLVRRLVTRYWPGPLTLVLSGIPEGLELVAEDGWTGVRLPAHEATRGLLATLDFPVVLTSANRHGERAATRAGEVAEVFGDALALVVDGGAARLGEASGVLRVGPGCFELEREGLLPLADLKRVAGLSIGFVCTGNTCRSPMAVGLSLDLLRRRLGARGHDGAPDVEDFGFTLRSMGVAAGPGSPVSEHALDVLAARGIDLSGHRTSAAVPEKLRDLDRVYCLTQSHLDAVRGLLPPGRPRHVELLDPEGHDVPDPIGGSRSLYERCAELILRAIESRAEDWA